MRWHLLKTFDKIYVLDLHGNANKQEVAPDGVSDSNVFDIRQGVAIIIAVKRRRKGDTPKSLAEVQHGELWGNREAKYETLWSGSPSTLSTGKLSRMDSGYPFVPRDFDTGGNYSAGFSIAQLMPANVTGIVSMGDGFIFADSAKDLRANIDILLDSECTAPELKSRFGLGKNYADWVLGNRSKLQFDENKIVPIDYRPFDKRWTYFDNKLLWRWRENVMRHIVEGNNFNLMVTRQTKDEIGALVGNTIAAHKAFSAYDITYNFPLYLYPEEGTLETERRINFDPKIYAEIAKRAGLIPSPLAGEGVIINY